MKSADLEQLVRDYRRQSAPADFAASVRTSISARSRNKLSLRLAAAIATVAFVALAVTLNKGESPNDGAVESKLPSFAAIAMPSKPAVRMPNLLNIRLTPTPPMPDKPGVRQKSNPKPDDNVSGQNSIVEEKHHELV